NVGCIGNDTLMTLTASENWCKKNHAHLCTIAELNSGMCCHQTNGQVWSNDTCQGYEAVIKKKKKKKMCFETAKTVYCSETRSEGKGQTANEITIGQYANDYRLKEVRVYVYLETDDKGEKSIYLKKGGQTVILAQDYTDTDEVTYGLEFADDSKYTQVVSNISGDSNFEYMPVQSLSQLNNGSTSGHYQLSVVSTDSLSSIVVNQWCVEVVYQRLLHMITTYFIDMPNTASPEPPLDPTLHQCSPYSNVVYNATSQDIVNSTHVSADSLERVACTHWFDQGGALQACIAHINASEYNSGTQEYYHICQFVIIGSNASDIDGCVNWNDKTTTVVNMSQMTNGETRLVPGEIRWTSSFYMQMPQFCPSSVCANQSQFICIDYIMQDTLLWALDSASLSVYGIEWNAQINQTFWALESSGDGFAQMSMLGDTWMLLERGQEVLHFVERSSDVPVINISLTLSKGGGGKEGETKKKGGGEENKTKTKKNIDLQHLNFFFFFKKKKKRCDNSRSDIKWCQSNDASNGSVVDRECVTETIGGGRSIPVFEVDNCEVNLITTSQLTSAVLFEAHGVRSLSIANSSFEDIQNTQGSCNIFSVSMARPLFIHVRNTTFDTIRGDIFTIVVDLLPQYVTVQDVSFTNIQG
ncbi:hypothetical protein RFI_15965, partial [Reticulomyxa filosa]